MFDREGFRTYYFSNVGQSQGAFNTYSSYLKRMDKAIGDIDLKLGELGKGGIMELIDAIVDEPFASHRSQCRSILSAYAQYFEDDAFDESTAEKEVISAAVASVFSYEKELQTAELQTAVRTQLTGVEYGLVAADGGSEAKFETGRADILARDAEGCAVVIELKAGLCPKGAIEQVLGYAQDWIEKGESGVRAVIIAGEFSPRTIAAAKLVPSLELKTYKLSLQFDAM